MFVGLGSGGPMGCAAPYISTPLNFIG